MTIEHKARVERTTFQPHMNSTELVVTVPGEVRPERSEIVVLTINEGAK